MNILDNFVENLCGVFNNTEQVEKELQEGKQIHPKAKHINGICNNFITNLPQDFNGYFVLEESYYDNGKFKNILPHLFLFTLNSEDKILLTSYEIPSGISKEDFRNDNPHLTMDYTKLIKSEKFTPMTYEYKDGAFYGESTSHFTPETTFILKEIVYENELQVSEVFYKNDKITFGFLDPIIYKKIN